MTRILTTAALIISLAASAHAGGPVIVTEEGPVAAQHDRKTGGLIAVGLGILILAAITGGNDTCNGEPEPTPEPGC